MRLLKVVGEFWLTPAIAREGLKVEALLGMAPRVGDKAMNIKIPSYEILNFEVEDQLVARVGVAKVYPRSLLTVLRQIQWPDRLTCLELEEVLSENGRAIEERENFFH